MKQGDTLGKFGMVLGIIAAMISIIYFLNFLWVFSFILSRPLFFWLIIGTSIGGLILSLLDVSIDGSKFGIVGNVCSTLALTLPTACAIYYYFFPIDLPPPPISLELRRTLFIIPGLFFHTRERYRAFAGLDTVGSPP